MQDRQGLARTGLRGGGARELPSQGVAFTAQTGLALAKQGDVAFGAGDAFLAERRRRLGARPPMFGVEARRIVCRQSRGEAVSTLAELGRSPVPGGQGRLDIITGRAGPAIARVRGRRHSLERLGRFAQPTELRREALLLGRVPGHLSGDGLGLSGDRAFGLLRSSTIGSDTRLLGACRLQRGARRARARGRCRHRIAERCEIRLRAVQVGGQAYVFRPALEHGLRSAERDPDIVDHGRAVARHRHPAGRQGSLDGEAGRQVR